MNASSNRYYEGGISSVYFWDLDHGFAGAILIKKAGDSSTKNKGCWDSIHVIEVQVLFKVILPKFHHTRGITRKHVASGAVHLHDLAPGQHSFEKTSQRWRAAGDIVSVLSNPVIEPMTSRTVSGVEGLHELVGLVVNSGEVWLVLFNCCHRDTVSVS